MNLDNLFNYFVVKYMILYQRIYILLENEILIEKEVFLKIFYVNNKNYKIFQDNFGK